MVKIIVNNNEYKVRDNITILEACHDIGIKLPTLCYLKGISETSSCRMCVVEIKNQNNLVPACSYKVYDNLEIYTNSLKVIKSRQKTLQLLLENHNRECLTCFKNGVCELQNLASIYDIKIEDYHDKKYSVVLDSNNHCIVRDNSKCILCNRCVNFCKNIEGVEAIKRIERGDKTYIGSAFNKTLDETKCIYCGGCVNVCPTGALKEKSGIEKVYEALNNPELEVVACYAPSVRVTIGEEFGYKKGENVASKLNTALRLLGFKEVFDVTYGADLTVMEEGTEFIERLENKENLPIMTSCCPAWVNYVKNFYPEYINNLSSVKSPQGIFGSVCKTYYKKKRNSKKKLFIVSIMPCIAKKDEIEKRDNATRDNDIDVVLTVKELSKMIHVAGLDLKTLTGSNFSSLIGKGNSVIFGTSGGVMETTLRYVKEKMEKKGSKNLVFQEVRGMKGLKEATYTIQNQEIKVLVASGISNIAPLLKNSEIKKYHFVEVMACPGGCINGAGTPFIDGYTRSFTDYIKRRSNGLYGTENNYKSKKAKDNVFAKNLYKEFLDEPGSDKARKILHTKFK